MIGGGLWITSLWASRRLPYSITNSGTAFAVRIAQTTGKTVDQSKGVALELDGQAVTSTLETDGDMLSALSTQSQVFAPGFAPHREGEIHQQRWQSDGRHAAADLWLHATLTCLRGPT